MKNKSRTLIILMIIFSSILVLFSGCKWDSKGTKKKVEAKLKEKYNQSFSTSAIGDRWNTDYTRLYCYPTNDKEILFEVTYYDNGEMTDDYIERKYECELERELISDLKDANIQAICRIDIAATGRDKNKNYSNMSLNEYIEDVETENLWTKLAINAESIKTDQDAKNLVNVIEKFSSKHNSVGVLIATWFIKNEQYDDCVEYFKKYPDISFTTMRIDYAENSDKSERETTIYVNRTKGSQTEIYPISIMEAAKVK